MTIRFTTEEHGIYSLFSGVITGEELAAHAERVCQDPAFHRHRYHIVDYLAVDRFGVGREDLWYAARVLKAASIAPAQPIRLSVAVASSAHALAFLERAVELGAYTHAKLFPTVATARAWVDEVSAHGGDYAPRVRH